MSRIGLGRHVSLLDEDSVDTPVDNGEVAVEEEVSAPIADATEETAEVEAEDIGAEQAMDSTEVLEEVEDAVVAAEADGGLDRQSAVFAHLAMKAAMGKADYDYFVRSSKIPSVESYNGGSSSRQRYTAITREGLVTALRGFWEAIVRQIKKMWAAVKNWYLKVLDAAPRMKARAEALAKKSGDITGSATEKSFDMGGVAQLAIDGKAPDPTKATATMKYLSEVSSKMLDTETSGQYDKMLEDFEDIIEHVSDMEPDALKNANVTDVASFMRGAGDAVKGGTASKAITKLVTTISSFIQANKAIVAKGGGTVDGATKRFGDDVDAYGGAQIFGQKQMVCLHPKGKAKSLVRLVRGSGFRIVDFKEKPKDVDNSGSWKTLSSSDIRSLMDELSDICDHIMTYKKAWENRDKQFGKMDSTAKKAIANAEKDKDSGSVKTRIVKDVALGMSALYQIGIRFENQLIQYLLAVGRTTITWVERSLSQYKSA